VAVAVLVDQVVALVELMALVELAAVAVDLTVQSELQ
jgi:hypothetical protein